jgi:isoleucyl-tRNA synthetase
VSKADSGRYKDTINLLKTEFSMRANAVEREPEIQRFWQEQRIYDRLGTENPGEPFIIHDGPPYSNGDLHMGHALNKVLKDIINRYHLLRGRKVRYIPGWDCHGLPIELKVLQSLSSAERSELTPITLRQRAKNWALGQVNQQREGFKRFGVWGDWDQPYLTLTPAYETAQLDVFGQMFLKGYIYRGLKPVHWSPSSRTALAEAELEYPDGHVSPSLYAAFRVTSLPDNLRLILQEYVPDLGFAIWTTTPWTIPGNLAVAVNGTLTYAIVDTQRDNLSGEATPQLPRYLVVASDLVDSLRDLWKTPLDVVARVMGSALEGATYQHPLYDRESPVIIGGDYITTESGTGLVHTAPGHGQEDFIAGQKYGLPVLCPVDEVGNFTAEAGVFAGLNVLKDANESVTQALEEAGSLILRYPYEHRYPYDWRTKKPTIFRATEQWFASVEGFREAAMTAITQVEWIPAQGQNRISSMVGERSDWCISRQRSWGVPIPVFYHKETGEALITVETLAHIKAIVSEKGSDAWWELTEAELLPEPYRQEADQYRKGTDTMDVWFDSGSSWAAVVQQNGLKYPVDLYLEGSDQHRGWFQSSLLTSVAVNGHAPYRCVLTHGFALDEKGHKMSKSLGNVVDPLVIINGGKDQKKDPPYGADVLRLWVSSVDYSSDVPIGNTILKQLADVYRKIRNTARYLLGNLHDFNPATDAVPYEQLSELDRYLLHRITEVFGEVTEAFETFQFYRFFQTIQNFCVVDLSNFYLDIAKDRLYISAPDDIRRRSCQTVLAIAIENLAKSIAPVLCHLAEEIWQNLPYRIRLSPSDQGEVPPLVESVFQAGWVQIEPQWHQPELGQQWQSIRQVRTEVNKVLEQARTDKTIGASLGAKVLLYVADESLREKLRTLNPALPVPSDFPTATPPVSPPVSPEALEDTESVSVAAEVVTPEETETVTALSLQALQQKLLELLHWAAQNRQLFTFFALIFAIVLLLNITIAFLSAVDTFPLLPSLMQLLGLGYVVWFIRRYLVFAHNRMELSGKVTVWKSNILGDRFPLVTLSETKMLTAAAPEAPEAIVETITTVEGSTEVPTEVRAEGTTNPTLFSSTPASISSTPASNGVDELRYLFLSSQVELLDSPESLQSLTHHSLTPELGVGIVTADGKKCDRCWNYSILVGHFFDHPDLCERCIQTIALKPVQD